MPKEQRPDRPAPRPQQPQRPQQPERLREAGNVEKRGGWQKPTVQPASAAQAPNQGMPPKPTGNAGQQGDSGQGSGN
jgi:hypothetical protein